MKDVSVCFYKVRDKEKDELQPSDLQGVEMGNLSSDLVFGYVHVTQKLHKGFVHRDGPVKINCFEGEDVEAISTRQICADRPGVPIAAMSLASKAKSSTNTLEELHRKRRSQRGAINNAVLWVELFFLSRFFFSCQKFK